MKTATRPAANGTPTSNACPQNGDGAARPIYDGQEAALPERAAQARKDAQFTPNQLAALVHQPGDFILRVETGKAKLGGARLRRWAKACNVGVDWLLGKSTGSCAPDYDGPDLDENPTLEERLEGYGAELVVLADDLSAAGDRLKAIAAGFYTACGELSTLEAAAEERARARLGNAMTALELLRDALK